MLHFKDVAADAQMESMTSSWFQQFEFWMFGAVQVSKHD